jgi:hypothetical protein
MGARVYRNGENKNEKMVEGVITKVTNVGAYVWQAKENLPQDTAEWFPFFCDKVNWSISKLRSFD